MSRRASAEAAAPAAAMPLDRHALLHAVFVQMDADGSGEVDLAEFKTIMRAGPNTKPPAGSLPQRESEGEDTAWYKKCAPCKAA